MIVTIWKNRYACGILGSWYLWLCKVSSRPDHDHIEIMITKILHSWKQRKQPVVRSFIRAFTVYICNMKCRRFLRPMMMMLRKWSNNNNTCARLHNVAIGVADNNNTWLVNNNDDDGGKVEWRSVVVAILQFAANAKR